MNLAKILDTTPNAQNQKIAESNLIKRYKVVNS